VITYVARFGIPADVVELYIAPFDVTSEPGSHRDDSTEPVPP
jgi:hypothetical protein